MKRIVLFSAILIILSVFAQAGENLLSNGGFEDGIYEWRIRESSLDFGNSFSGNVSLKMTDDLGNTWNIAASQAFDININKVYVLSLYSMNNGVSGDLYFGFRWINNAGVSLTYNWKRLRVGSDWEYYTLTARPPQGASKMQIYFRLGEEFDGDAWFDEVSLEESLIEMDLVEGEPLIGTGPLGFAGSLVSEISYTPEENLVGGHRLQLYSNIAFGTQIKGFINIGGWLPQEYQFHEFSGSQAIRSDFKIKKAYIEIDGPWFNGMKNFRTTFGDTAVEYSPYTIYLNRWDLWDWSVMDDNSSPANYNKIRRGISIQTLNWDNMGLGGYLIWDDKPTKYSFGGRLSLGKENANLLRLIFARYQDTTNISPGEKPYFVDQVVTLEGIFRYGNYHLKNTFGLNIKSSQDNSDEGNLNLMSAEYHFNDFSHIFVNYWSLSEKFDPIFRDRTPKFDPYTGKKLKWNLVDRLNGQNGGGFGMVLYKGINKIRLSYNKASTINKEIINNTTICISSMLGKVSVEFDYESTKAKKYLYEVGVINSNKHLSIDTKYLLYNDGVKSYWINGIYNLHDTAMWGKDEASYFLLGSRFNVLQTFIGVRTISEESVIQNGFVLGVKCFLAEIISVTVNYASPNRIEELATPARGFWDTRYDKYGHTIMADNIIKLSASVDF